MGQVNEKPAQSLGLLHFKPLFRSVRWGGTRLGNFKNIDSLPSERVGESWEISGLEGHETPVDGGRFDGKTITEILSEHGAQLLGEKLYSRYGNFFPLLVKFIDAEDDLSIQVHPDNANAEKGLGKTELWYIIKSEPGSYIYSGFNRPLTREKLTRFMDDNRLVDVLAKHFPSPGDVFYLPAGRIHSIGAGNLLLEIQQTSGITYRLHDYNRKDTDGKPRELHVRQALDVIDYSQTDFGLARPQMLIDCETRVKETPYFTVTSVQVMNLIKLEIAKTESPRIIVAIAGSGIIRDNFGNSAKIRQGHTVFVPANCDFVEIVAKSTPLKLLTVFIEE